MLVPATESTPSHHSAPATAFPDPRVNPVPLAPPVSEADPVRTVAMVLAAPPDPKDPRESLADPVLTVKLVPVVTTVKPCPAPLVPLVLMAVLAPREKLADLVNLAETDLTVLVDARENVVTLEAEATMVDPELTETPATVVPKAPLALATIALPPVWPQAIKNFILHSYHPLLTQHDTALIDFCVPLEQSCPLVYMLLITLTCYNYNYCRKAALLIRT